MISPFEKKILYLQCNHAFSPEEGLWVVSKMIE